MVNLNTLDSDESDLTVDIIRSLSKLDVRSLSFVQLRRLHTALTQAGNSVASESAVRAGTENLGDTVIVNATKLAKPR